MSHLCGAAWSQSAQQTCNEVGALGRSLAAERDKGMSLQDQLRRNEAVASESREGPPLKPLLDSLAQAVHGDMKKVSPEDTYWRLRTLCLSSRK